VVVRLFASERQSLGTDLGMISVLLATSLLVCTLVLPSRLRSLTRAFGIESVRAQVSERPHVSAIPLSAVPSLR